MENTDSEQLFTLRISGDELNKEDGYNLRYILKTFSSVENLVDKTYLHSQDRVQMTKSDKENISVRLLEVKEGSFVADFVIQMNDYLLPIIPLIAENPVQIWEAIKNSYTYIKTIMQAKQEGKEVAVTLDNNQNGIQVSNSGSGDVNFGDIHITVNPAIHSLSSKTAPVFSQLSNNVDGSSVQSIQLMDDHQDNIEFTEYEKRLFKKKVYLDENIMELNGKIKVSNFESLTGRIEIYDNDEDIIPGTYRFHVDKDKFGNEEVWKDIYLDEKIFRCQKRITLDPSKGFEEEISEIKLIGIKED